MDEILDSNLRFAYESKHGIKITSKNPLKLKQRLWLRRKKIQDVEPWVRELVITMGPVDNSEVWIIKMSSLSSNPREPFNK